MRKFLFLLTLSLGLLTVATAPGASALTYNVAVTTDTSFGVSSCTPGLFTSCSLRGAIIKANATPGLHTINVPAGTYVLNKTSGVSDEYYGDLDFLPGSNISIVGAGVGSTVIQDFSAYVDSKMFEIQGGSTLAMEELSVVSTVGTTDGIHNAGTLYANDMLVQDTAQGIYNTGLLNADNVDLSNNSVSLGNQRASITIYTNSTVQGGVYGVYNQGLMIMDTVEITGTSSYPLYVAYQGYTEVYRSTINLNGNGASGRGGIFIGTPYDGDITFKLIESTVSRNLSDNSFFAGGVTIYDSTDGQYEINVEIINSTISENESINHGGGLSVNFGTESNSSVEIVNTTISSNISDNDLDGNGDGSAIYVGTSTPSGAVKLKNNIVFDNSVSASIDECKGQMQSGEYNFLGLTCGYFALSNDSVGVDPVLYPLANYGGPTETHKIYWGTPAFDYVPAAYCVDYSGTAITGDQKGSARTTYCEAGSYETYRMP